ncbi:hypothetical protein JXA88_13665 [Candidatus Fermentibacteria bacterium]|nr:hypothetical protein [Candidatus Fermentibacteria bacterium]
MNRHRALFVVMCCVAARELAHADLEIGMNLSGPRDWTSDYAFANIMKLGRSWGTCNIMWYPGGQNVWDTGLIDSIPVDDDGYPLELPFETDHPDADTSQAVFSVWTNTLSLPQGIYVLLYDGQGEFDFDFDAEITAQASGRLEVTVQPSAGIMKMEILSSTLGNHVRNIRFLLPGTEYTHEDDPWSGEWKEKLEPFTVVRFMDWGSTNNSTMRTWSQRPKVDDYTYTINGIPYDWMVRLCNDMDADPWVCVPHLADSAYVFNLATLFRDSLETDRTVFVEYSNELWNWMFTQAHWGLDSLDQSLPWPERLGPRIEEVMAIWTGAFSGQTHRLVRVVGSQTYYLDIVDRILDHVDPALVDALAATWYVGLNGDSLDYYGAGLTADKVFDLAYEELRGDLSYFLRGNKAIADANALALLYYEGGQHFTPNPFGSIQPYNQVLEDVQTDPEMYEFYCELLDTVRAIDSQSLATHYSFISGLSGRYGSWGALENQFFQFPPYYPIAPKYQALLDHRYARRPAVSVRVVGADAVLSWPRVPNADAYTIYWSGEPHGSFGELGATADTMFVDGGAALSPMRFYRVTATTAGSP